MTVRLVLLAVLAAALAGCGGDDGGEVAPTAPTTTAAAEAWKRVVAGGDCQCSDGSPFSYFVREASPTKVVFYLQDGGACYSAETCAADNDLFTRSVEGPTGEGGIFDFADDRNPFANHSFVYVPYCTGDVHLGSVTTEYAPGLTVRHKGFVNATAALDDLAAAFPGATDVVVIGESAGSIAAPLYAGLAADRLPDARIAVVADGSGAYPDSAALNDVLAAWGFGNTSPNWPESADLPAEQWSFPGLFIQSGRHDAEIVFARHDYAFDDVQQSRLSLIGIRARNLLARIDANEAQIEDAGVNLLSYIAPGDDHTVLSDGLFYREAVNGVKLVDWVTRLIERKPVEDVHCRKCLAG